MFITVIHSVSGIQQSDSVVCIFIYSRAESSLRGFPLVVLSGGYSLVVVCGLLIVVVSLVAEYRL